MVKAVKPKNKEKNSLHLVAPTNLKLKKLALDGLLIPKGLDDKEAYAPLDFTSLSSRDVGRQHSYWAVRHSHIIYLVGNLRAEVGNFKYDLKNAEAQWMIKRQGEFKNKWEAEYALGRSKVIRKLRKKMMQVESSLIRYEALAESYKSLREAASREIARRSDERASRD